MSLAAKDLLAVPLATYDRAKVLAYADGRDEAVRALQTICGTGDFTSERTEKVFHRLENKVKG